MKPHRRQFLRLCGIGSISTLIGCSDSPQQQETSTRDQTATESASSVQTHDQAVTESPTETLTPTATESKTAVQTPTATFTTTETGASVTQESKISLEDGEDGDAFASSVAMSGDGTTAIIGVPYDDNTNGENAGSAYIFERKNGKWRERKKLYPEDGDSDDFFGRSVTISGDGTTAIVGAGPSLGGTTSDRGYVYVFQKINGEWKTQKELSTGGNNERYGTSVTVSGDGTTVIVGAPDLVDPDAGSAYALRQENGEWQKTTLAPNESGSPNFGVSVAVSSDGKTTVIGDEPTYVFRQENGEWSQEAKLPASGDHDKYTAFGNSVAISGDGTTAVVGAPAHDDIEGAVPGSAYVFQRDNGEWRQETERTASDGDLESDLAVSVAISSDGTTILAGAPDDESTYMYRREDGWWREAAKLASEDGDSSEKFGQSVAISSDGKTALVGASGDENTNGKAVGSTYAFNLSKWGPSERTGSRSAANVKIDRVTIDRTSSIVTPQTTVFTDVSNDSTATLFGGPVSASVLIQFTTAFSSERDLDRARCIVADSTGSVVGSWTSDLSGAVKNGTYTCRVQIQQPLDPGEYLVKILLQNDTASIGSEFEILAEGTTSLTVKGTSAEPVVSIPRTDRGSGRFLEQSLGRQYNVSLKEQSPAVRFTLNTLSILTGIATGQTLPQFGINNGVVNELAATTAQVRLRTNPEEGRVRLLWENRAQIADQGTRPLEIHYDRAVLTARVSASIPYGIEITDTSDVAYQTYDRETGEYVLVWIETAVDKGIEPKGWAGTFEFDNPTGEESFTIDNYDGQEIEVEYSLSLELGPLAGKATEQAVYNAPQETRIEGIPSRYDYESWQLNPDEAYWMSVGLTKNSQTIDISPPSRSDTESDNKNQKSKIAPKDGNPNGEFGQAVTISKDGSTAIVAAPSGGAAYVFAQENGRWREQTKLVPEDGGAGDGFGRSVTVSNDGSTALIGAWRDENSNGMNAGSAYVFQRESGQWREAAKLVPDNGSDSDFFGITVTLSGDGKTALIAATGAEDPSGVQRGAVYVFRRVKNEWREKTKLGRWDGDVYDTFGFVTMSGDVSTALVGAPGGEGPNGENVGSVYVFQREGDGWRDGTKIVSNDGNSGDKFGQSVAVASDGTTALIGAPGDDDPTGKSAGSAYVLRREDGRWREETKLIPTDGDSEDLFGRSVAVSSDGTTALVGAPGDEDPNGKSAGSAYVFHRGSDGWREETKLVPTDGDPDDMFGRSVAVSGSGTIALIGAFRDDSPSGSYAGSTYVFELDS